MIGSTTTTCFSQNTITGIVKDNIGVPIAFATLKFYAANNNITQPQVEKIADSVGNFIVQVKNAGNYSIAASSVGYADTTIQIIVGSSVCAANVVMTKQENYISTVVVSRPKLQTITRKIYRFVMTIRLRLENLLGSYLSWRLVYL
jgi:hypothetical protein